MAAHAVPPEALGAALGPLAARAWSNSARLMLPSRLRSSRSNMPAGALGAALLAGLARLLGGRPAVIVDVEPGEALVGALDHLLAGDVGVAVAARRRARLGQRGAGEAEQRGAGEDVDLLHGRWLRWG